MSANNSVLKSKPVRVALIAALTLLAGQALALEQSTRVFTSALPVAGSDASRPLIQVDLDSAALKAAKPGQVLRLDVPGFGSHEVVFDGSHGNKWMGHLKAGIQYSVVVITDEQGASGHIVLPEGRFRLGYANGGQWLVREGQADASAEIAALPAMFRAAANLPAAELAKKPAKAAYPVSFDLVAMSNLKPGDDVALSLPGLGSHRVAYEETRASDSGNNIWVGYLKDYGTDFRVVVTSGPEGSVGNIFTPSGELELTMQGNQQWLVDRKASKLNSFIADHSDAHIVPTTLIGKPSGGATPNQPMLAGLTDTTSTSTPATTTTTTTSTTAPANVVDLLVLTTPGFQTVRGTSWRLRIDQVVALANQAYIDSKVSTKVRLVGVEIINTPDNTSNTTTVTTMAAAGAPFNNVPTLRNTYGADLVTLIRPFYNAAQGGSCGVGYVLGSANYNISMYAAYAYSVVSDGKDTAGTSYYCTDYTLAHEMGHNMGSMHDRATVASQGGGQGAYSYGFGYGLSGTFGTIMSYISPRIGKFSNPKDLTCGGKYACGISEVNNTTSSANNVLSLNNTGAAVASFRPTQVPNTMTISGVVSKAGVAVAGVAITPSTSGVTCTASGSTGAYSCTVPLNWSGSLTPSLTGATFTPATLSFTGVLSSKTNQNFAKN